VFMRRPELAPLALAAALAVTVLSGCSPMPDFGDLTVDDTYQVGKSALDDGDDLVATEAFRRITTNSPMHELADDAMIGLADAYRQMGDHASAEQYYTELMIDYPRSPLVPEANYKLGLTYYEQSPSSQLDQGMTLEAIRQLGEFSETYPDSPFVEDALEKKAELRARLAKKDYESGMLYLSLDSIDAARVYFEEVADEYGDTVWGRRALLQLARTYRDEGSAARAEEIYGRLMEDHPGTEEAAAASAEAGAVGP